MRNFTDFRVLVIGDIILDEYIEGSVTRLSPEAPIPILDKQKEWYRLGGASNVAKNISSLGARVTQMGRIGLDRYGEMVQKELEASNIDIQGVLVDESVPTIVKTRFVCNNTQLLRVDFEDRTSIEKSEIGEAVMDFMEIELQEYHAVIISDYNKGMIFPALARKIGEVALKHNVIAVVDTHKTDWSVFSKYTCITPNKKELEIAVHAKLNTMTEIKDAAEFLRNQLELQYLLVTLSEQGMLMVTPEKTTHIPVEETTVIDVTGAGDTAIAVFTLALASGMPAEEAARLSNRAASLVVAKMGTATLTAGELS